MVQHLLQLLLPVTCWPLGLRLGVSQAGARRLQLLELLALALLLLVLVL
jgi:hypothetical protein